MMRKTCPVLIAILAFVCIASLLPACAEKGVGSTSTPPANIVADPPGDSAEGTDDPALPTEEIISDGFAASRDANSLAMVSAYILGVESRSPEGLSVYDYPISEFDYDGEEIIWTISLSIVTSIDTSLSTQTGFAVLCDGVPTPFRVVSSGEELMHLSQEHRSYTYKIAFTPRFASSLGRIDFLSFANEEMFSYNQLDSILPYASETDFQLSGMPSRHIAKLPNNLMTSGLSILATSDYSVPVREALSAYTTSGLQRIAAQLMGESDYDESASLTALKAFDLTGEENFVFELAAGEPGFYRLAAMLDYEPFPLFDGESVIDCHLSETEMLSFTRPIGDLIPKGTHSFFVIATRLDGDILYDHPMESLRYELTR